MEEPFQLNPGCIVMNEQQAVSLFHHGERDIQTCLSVRDKYMGE